MSITQEKKAELISEYRRSDADTGSPDVQIAILTHRIKELTAHLKTHKKDYSSRRGLLMKVSQRRRQLDYLKKTNPGRYLELLKELDIRK